eukprot:COSAG01_NODE_5200_length_4415_cov_3.887396_7_plen_436_part_00
MPPLPPLGWWGAHTGWAEPQDDPGPGQRAIADQGGGGAARSCVTIKMLTKYAFGVLATAQYVVTSLVATTFFYRELYQLQNFPQFTNQLNTLGTTITMGTAALAVFGGVCSPGDGLGMWCCSLGLDGLQLDGEWSRPVFRGKLFTLRLQLLFGMLNAAGNLLQLMAIDAMGPHYSTLSTILNQASIPFSMALSKLLVGRRYCRTQLLGATVVIAGVAVSVAPQLIGGGGGSSSGAGGGGGGVALALWVAVYVFSCLPLALLNVLVEQHLPPPPPLPPLPPIAGGNRRRSEHTHTPLLRLHEQQQPPQSTGRPLGFRGVMLRTLLLVAAMNIASAPFNLLGAVLASLLKDGSLQTMGDDYSGGWACLFGGASTAPHANASLQDTAASGGGGLCGQGQVRNPLHTPLAPGAWTLTLPIFGFCRATTKRWGARRCIVR